VIRQLSYFVFCVLSANSYAQLSFSSLDSVFAYADKNSTAAKISEQQELLAKWTKVAALVNSVPFRSPISFAATDNLLLPVNFIPAEIFGGPAGSVREVRFGQEYVSNFSINPQIDIINPLSLARYRSSVVNEELTQINNDITKKNLRESIAAAYYNITSAQEQLIITQKNLESADSLLFIIGNKVKEGISRGQDLNNAKANQLLTKDKLSQLKANLEIQLNSLRILCDIPANTSVKIDNKAEDYPAGLQAGSSLQTRLFAAQSSYAKSELNANRAAYLPVVSLVYFQGWQKNSNNSFTDASAPWFQSKYIGLRITLPFPPDAGRIAQTYNSKVSYKISSLNASHAQLQTNLSNQNLALDFEKSLASYEAAKKVRELKEQNYTKSLNQYREGILPADLLLTAFNDMLNSKLNEASAQGAADYSKSKIKISNSFK
jgi:outer membrane protein TolC